MLQASKTEPFVIVDLLQQNRHLGYAATNPNESATPRYVAYGERTLSTDPNVRRRNDEPFAQLDYAIYLDSESDIGLLGSSVRSLPIDGRRATASVPFGNRQLLLVMTPIGTLSNGLFANLWSIVLALGLIITLVTAWFTQRTLERRDIAVSLADENARLYDEQREIAETLQIGLLPQRMEVPDGFEVAARYWPAGTASLIGGDFYDVFRVDDHRWGVTIGDVCGKGVEAAALTGLARYTVRAAARAATSPSDVLRAVHAALRDHDPPTYCTACFMYIESSADGERVRLALGGHPPPLLRRIDGTVTAIGEPGTILGMIEPELTDVTVDVVPGVTFVLYTDGLTDAPGDQAVPISEVEDLLSRDGAGPSEELANKIRVLKRRRRPRGSADDTALIVLRYRLPEGDPIEAMISTSQCAP